MYEDILPKSKESVDHIDITVSISLVGLSHDWLKSDVDVMRILDSGLLESARRGGGEVLKASLLKV